MLPNRRVVRSGICALVVMSALAACGSDGSQPAAGSGSGTGGSDSGGDQSAAIQGIATPSSVAVVTATNAD